MAGEAGSTPAKATATMLQKQRHTRDYMSACLYRCLHKCIFVSVAREAGCTPAKATATMLRKRRRRRASRGAHISCSPSNLMSCSGSGPCACQCAELSTSLSLCPGMQTHLPLSSSVQILNHLSAHWLGHDIKDQEVLPSRGRVPGWQVSWLSCKQCCAIV